MGCNYYTGGLKSHGHWVDKGPSCCFAVRPDPQQLPCQGFVVRHVDEKADRSAVRIRMKAVEKLSRGDVPNRDGYFPPVQRSHSGYYCWLWVGSHCRSSSQAPLLPLHFHRQPRPADPRVPASRCPNPAVSYPTACPPVPIPPLGLDPAF